MTAPVSVLPIGLSAAGKSSYLAAFSEFVQFSKEPKALKLARLDGDTSYVNMLLRKYQCCEKLERTTGPTQTTRMHLERNGNELGILVFPDLPGEEYDRQWSDRVCSQEFQNLAVASDHLILFLHPKSGGAPVRLADLDPSVEAAELLDGSDDEELAAAVVDQKSEVERPDEKDDGLPKWNAEKSPAQTKLVDVIQMMVDIRRPTNAPLKIAVLVSAWDSFANSRFKSEPKRYFESSDGFALLSQFFDARPELFTTRVFGVSAQGGCYKKDIDRLTSLEGDRAFVVDESGKRGDVTAPLLWLLQ